MICFVIFLHWPLFCASWAPKKQFLEVLPIFFKITGLQHKFITINTSYYYYY